MSAARRLLDRVHARPQLDELLASPAAYAAAVAAELPTGDSFEALCERDAALTTALADLEPLTVRAMKLSLAHALADDSSLAPATRTVFASTVTSYRDRLDVLAQRAHDLGERGGAGDPRDVAARVLASARTALALREALRAGVLALVQEHARAAIPVANSRARDRALDDAQRERFSAVRRDLEMLVEEPARIEVAPMPARVAAWPAQLDEPAAEPERSFADFIELD